MKQLPYRIFDTELKEFVVSTGLHTIDQITNDYAGLGNRYLYDRAFGERGIYENDVIEDEGDKYIVRFGDWEFSEGFTFEGRGFYLENHMGQFPFSKTDAVLVKIIGNIHKHPELLNQ